MSSLVTMEHCAGLLLHSDSPQMPPRENLVSNEKCVPLLIWRTVRLGIRPQVLSTERNCRHTADVINRCKQSTAIGICC